MRVLATAVEDGELPSSAVESEVGRKLLSLRYLGGLVAVPPRNTQAVVPFVYLQRRDSDRERRVVHVRNETLVLVDLHEGRVHLDHMFRTESDFDWPQLGVSEGGTDPEPSDVRSAVLSTQSVDLRQHLGLPLSPGRYSACVIEHNWLTNVARFEVIGEQPPSLEPALPLPQARAAAQRLAALAESGQALPAFDQRDDHPSLGDEDVAVSVPEVLTTGKPATMHLVARVELQPGQVTVDHETREPTVPAALVRVTAVLKILDEHDPPTAEIEIPIHGNAKVGQQFEIAASIDLRDWLGEHLRPSSHAHQLYLFVGDAVSGPHPLRVPEATETDQC